MHFLLGWLLFAVFSAILANAKGRSTVGWFFCGLFFGPFGLLVALMPSVVNPFDLKNNQITDHYLTRQTKRCPFCAEPILLDAIKCKHCGSSVSAEPPSLSENQPQERTQMSRSQKFGYRLGRHVHALLASKT